MKIGVVAGEASGDYLGGRLVEAIKKRVPDAAVTGICGPRMIAAGAVSMYPMESISIMGLDDLASNLIKIVRIRTQLLDYFLAQPPDVFIGIDVPDFNLGLEVKLRRHGIKTVHYVSPTVWAWRHYRLPKIRRAVDHMLTLFPFEADYYRRHGVPVTFVGHPVADEIDVDSDAQQLRNSFGVQARYLVALLPGSRQSELHRLGGLFLDVAERVLDQCGDVEFIAPFANQQTHNYFADLAQRRRSVPVQLIDGKSRQAMAASDVALVASGTAALEAALLKKPMVVAYKVSWLTGVLVKMFARVGYFSMPNNLLDKPIVPELMQSHATVQNLTQEVMRLLADEQLRTEIAQKLATITETLKRNASDKAADVILNIIRAGP